MNGLGERPSSGRGRKIFGPLLIILGVRALCALSAAS
jgi:hypothetical protein